MRLALVIQRSESAVDFLTSPDQADLQSAMLPLRPDYESLADAARNLGHELSLGTIQEFFSACDACTAFHPTTSERQGADTVIAVTRQPGVETIERSHAVAIAVRTQTPTSNGFTHFGCRSPHQLNVDVLKPATPQKRR